MKLRADLFDEIEGKRWAARSQRVEESDLRIEPCGQERALRIAGEQRVKEGKDNVDRIARRTAVSTLEIEQFAYPWRQQGPQGTKIAAGTRAFNSANFVRLLRVGQSAQVSGEIVANRANPLAVFAFGEIARSLEKDLSLIIDFPSDDGAHDLHSGLRRSRRFVLRRTKKHVAGQRSLQAVEKAAASRHSHDGPSLSRAALKQGTGKGHAPDPDDGLNHMKGNAQHLFIVDSHEHRVLLNAHDGAIALHKQGL
ncbi:hypothetical protein SAMN05421799_1019 [Alicyclobacillus vulcanalis]|uniref:Uncharacterized protein n=1 Tax=Alicyclobacillus vulcanalis TaxID=252246 RepID=A0A1N7JJF1_9BACL|nr:hypothetical protein SAMN05421799_1019 [Alicyclobacillus vulcanalis]